MSKALTHRKIHRLIAIITLVPTALILGTGVLLLLKKQWTWVQPSASQGVGGEPTVSFTQVLEAVRSVPEAGIDTWNDIYRYDFRPGNGMIKIRSRNRWEVQIDAATAEVLQVAYRRSDILEALHDGSWFHPMVKLWIWLPVALMLCGLWVSGAYLWLLPYRIRARTRRRRTASADRGGSAWIRRRPELLSVPTDLGLDSRVHETIAPAPRPTTRRQKMPRADHDMPTVTHETLASPEASDHRSTTTDSPSQDDGERALQSDPISAASGEPETEEASTGPKVGGSMDIVQPYPG